MHLTSSGKCPVVFLRARRRSRSPICSQSPYRGTASSVSAVLFDLDASAELYWFPAVGTGDASCFASLIILGKGELQVSVKHIGQIPGVRSRC